MNFYFMCNLCGFDGFFCFGRFFICNDNGYFREIFFGVIFFWEYFIGYIFDSIFGIGCFIRFEVDLINSFL